MTKILLFTFLLLGCSAFEGTKGENPPPSTVEVTLKQGKIITSRVDLKNGKYHYAFKSIPFAEPPVDQLRFK
ncbi:hypothetical protein SK128_000050, partial [Halocaridina rubra]